MIAQVSIVRCTVCNDPYVLRLAMALDGGVRWIYARDCKHKLGLPVGWLDAADVETAPLVVLSVAPAGA